jgi:23S rRNA pseudouridine1911/1915/1917 synthase
LLARLTGFSRSRTRGLIDHGGAQVNGVPCVDAGARLRSGDRLQVRYDPERRYREKPPERATRGFTVVFADQHLAIVVKEAGLLTVPTPRGEPHTLIDRLSVHLAQGSASRRSVAVVHRLDRDTSGLLVFGRTPRIARELSAQFAQRKPEREYATIVAGLVRDERGELRSHLASDDSLTQRSVSAGGELAISHFEVRARFADATLLAVRLETGRRNQIRAQFAELGHPVLGDTRYRPELAAHRRWPYPRLALHARLLGFRHPVTGEALRFECPLPREFDGFAATIRANASRMLLSSEQALGQPFSGRSSCSILT